MQGLEREPLLGAAYGFWIAFLAAAVIANPVLQTLIRMKSRQTVSQYAPESHQKKQGTPTMGGVIIVIAVLVAALVVGVAQHYAVRGVYLTTFVGFAVIGFVDDFVVPRMIKGKRGLGWRQKILMQVGVAILALLIRGDFRGWEPAATVFLVLFFSNAYNFADGLDGLAGTIGVLFCAGIIALATICGFSNGACLVAAILAGAMLPFLALNAPPAKVFMGDVGSLPIGAAMGLMVSELMFPALKVGALDPSSEWYLGRPFVAYVVGGELMIPVVVIALAVLSLLLAAELIPVPLQIASVKLRKKKIFTSTPIHHGFEAKGWPESRVVWRFALVQLLLTVLAITIVIGPATAPVRRDPAFRTAANP